MPSGCAERFREIQSARDELVYGAVVRAVVRGASSRYGGQNGGPTQISFKHVNRAMRWLSFVMWCVPLSLWASWIMFERWEQASNRGVEDHLPSNSGLKDELLRTSCRQTAGSRTSCLQTGGLRTSCLQTGGSRTSLQRLPQVPSATIASTLPMATMAKS